MRARVKRRSVAFKIIFTTYLYTFLPTRVCLYTRKSRGNGGTIEINFTHVRLYTRTYVLYAAV